MSTLLYNSATDIKVSRSDLANLQTPPPIGSRHAPYPFHSFVQDTVNAIQNSGYVIGAEDYAITKNENRLFGLLTVSRPIDFAFPYRRHDTFVGLRGAHDQSISRGLTIGSRVMVCSNLCFSGDLGNWKSKQTTNIADRIPDMVSDAVAGLGHADKQLTVDFDSFAQRQLTRDQGDDILLDIFRSGGFSASQLGRAVSDWDECSVPEHTEHGRSAWWLFNSCTHALKPTGANSNHSDLQHRSTIIYNKMVQGSRPLLAA